MSQSKKGTGARGKKAAGKGHADDKGRDVLQAVILAESFQDRFKPLTIDRPRCLLPLANTPLIEYTLEYLAMNGVQEVFLYCGVHADQIEAYLAASPRWAASSKTNPFQSLDIVRVGQASSLGDFLRDLDKRGTIGGDFVLVHGDLVANVPLDPILARHRARREANRDAIMTMVLRDASDGLARTRGIEPLFVLDTNDGRCLQYDEMSPLDHPNDQYLIIDKALLEGEFDFIVYSNLVDCGIDICTPDVLALWTESFDCELPRKNFLHNVLKDRELNGKLIYTDIVDDTTAEMSPTTSTAATVGGSYAARVTSLQMYDAIARDVLGRWTYPLVPETNLVPGHSYTSMRRRRGRGSQGGGAGVGVSAERGVTIDATASVARAALGLHTSIGAGSKVSGSTLGRRCRIGNNVRIKNCYVWDDVVIGDNTVVTRAILASGVHVGADCVVPAGSVLSYGVAVADGTTLVASGPGAPVVLATVKPSGAEAADDVAVVGVGGKGAPYHYAVDGDDDDAGAGAAGDAVTPESLLRLLIQSTEHLNLSTPSISSFGSNADDDGSDVCDDDDDDDGNGNDIPRTEHASGSSRSRLPSSASQDESQFSLAGMRGGDGGSLSGSYGAGMTMGSMFHMDAVSGLLDALRDDGSSDFESARLEFMGLRLSTDASDGAVRRAVAAAFAQRALELTLPLGATSASMPGALGQGLDAAKAAERAVKSKTGAAKFVRDVGVGSGSVQEQVEFVLALQRTLVGLRIREEMEKERAKEGEKTGGKAAPAPGTLLAALLQQLYSNDVLEEEGILAWWADRRAAEGGSGVSGDSSMAGAKERCRVLVAWLEEADEDSDDDSDDDDDDDDEEEEDDD